MGKTEIAALESLLGGGTRKRKSKTTRKFTSKEPPEIAQQTRILRAARSADSARDRSGQPSGKQIGSRATLDILKKQEAREKKRAQQKKERKFTDQAPPEIAQQTRTLMHDSRKIHVSNVRHSIVPQSLRPAHEKAVKTLSNSFDLHFRSTSTSCAQLPPNRGFPAAKSTICTIAHIDQAAAASKAVEAGL
jgi:hypothetical protein